MCTSLLSCEIAFRGVKGGEGEKEAQDDQAKRHSLISDYSLVSNISLLMAKHAKEWEALPHFKNEPVQFTLSILICKRHYFKMCKLRPRKLRSTIQFILYQTLYPERHSHAPKFNSKSGLTITLKLYRILATQEAAFVQF